MKQSLLLLCLCISQILSAADQTKQAPSQYGFIENKGQIIDQHNLPNTDVLYLYNGTGLHVQLKRNGFSYERIQLEKRDAGAAEQSMPFEQPLSSYTNHVHRVDISFEQSAPADITAEEPSADHLHYYTAGGPSNGTLFVRHFRKVVYRNVYPFIDVEFVLNEGQFKYNFIVRPGGNVNQIRMLMKGANQTALTSDGQIRIVTDFGEIMESIPYSYQGDGKNAVKVHASFIRLGENLYGISTADFDQHKQLVIDPLPWVTYFGGSADDNFNKVCADLSGNIIGTGNTNSVTHIATAGSFRDTFSGGAMDAFVVKYDSGGNRLWAMYYGGSGDDGSYGVVTDATAAIYIAGRTSSASYISSGTVYQTINRGQNDAFLVKLNANGTRVWATYFGGTENEYCMDLAIDPKGDLLMTGFTSSASYIASAGAHQTIFGGSNDGFICKFDSSGARLWGTYYGGSNEDRGFGIISDVNKNVIITGYTESSGGISSIGSFQPNGGGNTDAFVAKFSPSGTRLWATYYGGSKTDYGKEIASDAQNNIVITGYSQSTNSIATPGAFQTTYGGSFFDAMVIKFDSLGNRSWGTYYGGSNIDFGVDITIDAGSNILLAGSTSSASGISAPGAYRLNMNGTKDAFVAKLDQTGARLWATYYGGNSLDDVSGICIIGNSRVIIAGTTNSSSALSTAGAAQTTYMGGNEGFLGFFDHVTGLPVKLTYFKANITSPGKQMQVICKWATASEINNDHFTIERSSDNKTFEAIGNVQGKGNSVVRSEYAFTDEKPLRSVSYYRLKQTDFDGTSTFSAVQVVDPSAQHNTSSVIVYDHQVAYLQYQSATEASLQLKLYNASGTLVWEQHANVSTGENRIAIDALGTAGVYVLEINNGNGTSYLKLLK